MTKAEIAARLIALQHSLNELVSDFQLLFQDVVDSIEHDTVD